MTSKSDSIRTVIKYQKKIELIKSTEEDETKLRSRLKIANKVLSKHIDNIKRLDTNKEMLISLSRKFRYLFLIDLYKCGKVLSKRRILYISGVNEGYIIRQAFFYEAVNMGIPEEEVAFFLGLKRISKHKFFKSPPNTIENRMMISSVNNKLKNLI